MDGLCWFLLLENLIWGLFLSIPNLQQSITHNISVIPRTVTYYLRRYLIHFLIECFLHVRNRSLSDRAVKYVHKLALYTLGHVWAYGYPFINRYIISRIFAYARVSTIEQDTQNQIAEIKAAGFTVK